MQRALVEAVLVGALCGAVGVHVLLRRLPFFTITVAHATFPGVVLAVIVGASVLSGAIVSAALLVAGIWSTGSEKRLATSTVVGVALAGSFGLGAMLQSTQDGFTKDLASILVGQIIAVQRGDLVVTAIIGVLVLGAMTARLITHRVHTAMFVSSAFGVLAGVGGLTISAQWRVAAGAAITLTAAGIFLVVLAVTSVRGRPADAEQFVVLTETRRAPQPAR
jgi:manganese/iron transport system permease protein